MYTLSHYIYFTAALSEAHSTMKPESTRIVWAGLPDWAGNLAQSGNPGSGWTFSGLTSCTHAHKNREKVDSKKVIKNHKVCINHMY